jgi:hypothetical protein
MVAEDLTTAMMDLDAGRVEYRLDRRGPACVLVCHGGHVRAGLAVGEELFAELGYTAWGARSRSWPSPAGTA